MQVQSIPGFIMVVFTSFLTTHTMEEHPFNVAWYVVGKEGQVTGTVQKGIGVNNFSHLMMKL